MSAKCRKRIFAKWIGQKERPPRGGFSKIRSVFDQTPLRVGRTRTRPLWHSYSASSIMLTSPYPKRDIQAAVSPSPPAIAAGGQIW